MQDLSSAYPVWFCDIWGVVHDGLKPYANAVATLIRHRGNGGTVILVSNSPRTSHGVARQLDEIGVDRGSYDAVVTSGDVTRALIASDGGGKVFHLGPARDLSIFDGLGVARVGLSEAHAVLCTGLFDDLHESPDDYSALLHEMKSRGLTMICANPDRVVRVGNRLLYCAGALAEVYATMGGRVLMAGKPHKPIYDVALAEAQRTRTGGIALSTVLAIGDGPETDIKGAADYGLDALLIAAGVTDAADGLEAAAARVRAAHPSARILGVMHELTWTG